MITPKIKTLFQFIEFLHSNIDNFKQYDEVLNELYLLKKERRKVSPRKNFKDKLKYDQVQAEIKNKFKIIQENIITPIQAKANELNVCDLNKTETLWNRNISEVGNLKENFTKKDIAEIIQHKRKYLEFRTKTNCSYFQDFFFSELDEILKELFDFFKESEQNEFEAFEKKPIEVNGITELAEIMSGKNELKIEIDKDLSITKKLDFWKSVIDKYFNEPLTKQFGEYEFTFEQEQAKRKQLVKLFGTNYSLVSPLLIPEHIYNEHFENALNEPEFTYWFLQHHARTYFDVEIRMKRLPEKLNTPLSEKFIKAELKKLNDFEQKAETLLHESNLDIYTDYSYSEYAKEIEYLRIKAGYYKTHALPNVHAKGDTVVLYAKHIYLKEYLEKKLKKALPSQPIIESPFSVLEWATIFYYADETKLLSESRLIKERMEQFMNKHQINTTFGNFKTKYYEAKKRINEKNDYPVNKLELIISFLKENYKQTVTKIENDITFLEENKPGY